MKNININKAKSALDFGNKLLYIWIGFGIFLIIWRIYYYWIGHPVRLWVTLFWLTVAFWLIGYPLYAIPFYSRLHRSVLCDAYDIEKEYLVIRNLHKEILKIPWRNK